MFCVSNWFCGALLFNNNRPVTKLIFFAFPRNSLAKKIPQLTNDREFREFSEFKEKLLNFPNFPKFPTNKKMVVQQARRTTPNSFYSFNYL